MEVVSILRRRDWPLEIAGCQTVILGVAYLYRTPVEREGQPIGSPSGLNLDLGYVRLLRRSTTLQRLAHQHSTTDDLRSHTASQRSPQDPLHLSRFPRRPIHGSSPLVLPAPSLSHQLTPLSSDSTN